MSNCEGREVGGDHSHSIDCQTALPIPVEGTLDDMLVEAFIYIIRQITNNGSNDELEQDITPTANQEGTAETCVVTEDIANQDIAIQNTGYQDIGLKMDESHLCKKCEEHFGEKSQLLSHPLVHKGEKPFPCEFCEKSFTKRRDLIRHIRIHTKEKPFACEYCEKSFAQKAHLKDHIRTHTKEKPFMCEFCDKSFAHKSSLKKHIRTHTIEKTQRRKMSIKKVNLEMHSCINRKIVLVSGKQ